MRSSACLLVKTLTKVQMYFSLMYPSRPKQSMATETQDPPTLLPSHPRALSLSKISHHHCICISANRKGKRGREGQLEDAQTDSAGREKMDNGVIPTDLRGQPCRIYLHRKSDYTTY